MKRNSKLIIRMLFCLVPGGITAQVVYEVIKLIRNRRYITWMH
jgi:hypothetical protein